MVAYHTLENTSAVKTQRKEEEGNKGDGRCQEYRDADPVTIVH